MRVRYQQLAFELAEHAHETRLIAVVEFAAGEFQLRDDVDAHARSLYSGWMPATRTYSVQRSRSARTSASQAARSVVSHDRPNSSIRFRTSGTARAALISPFNCSTISRGVAAGTAMARKPVSSKPGKAWWTV